MTDTTPTPEQMIAALEAKAEIVRTPCGDGEMVWQRWGKPTDKTPLVLLHGGFGAWTHWFANVERLSADRLVVTCDMPGQGDSAKAPGEPTPANMAAPIAGGLDAVLGKGVRFDLAAFSFGSVLGVSVAAMVKDRCRTYVAVGGSGWEGLHVKLDGVRIPGKDADEAERDQTHRDNLNILMLWNKDAIDDLALHIHRDNVERCRVQSRRHSLSNHFVDTLPEVSARLSGIWGVHDATGGGREKILMRRDIIRSFQPNAPFYIIENAGHWVMYEQPAEFEKDLLEILDA